MIWFTSDLHLGHRNIVGEKVSSWKDGFRDFDSVKQMDDMILKAINDNVEEDDTLYILGDFSFKGNPEVGIYRNRIVCKNIIFIKGNHDKRKVMEGVFGHCYDFLEEDIEGTKFCMIHYAMRIWPKSHHGSIHLYGHSHSKLEGTPWGKSMDVGIDNAYRLYREWRPFSLVEVQKIMDKRDAKLIDHHGTSEDKKGEKRVQS